MRTPAILAGLVLCVAGGCQVIAQLDDLQVAGTGGSSSMQPPMCMGSCPGGQVCSSATAPPSCQPCGEPTPAPSCGQGCSLCTNGLCARQCGVGVDRCTGTEVLDATQGPVELNAHGFGEGLNIQCTGPYQCHVLCGGGDCENLTMHCSADGPCQLDCDPASCVNAQLFCGPNACGATCAAGNVTLVDPTLSCQPMACE